MTKQSTKKIKPKEATNTAEVETNLSRQSSIEMIKKYEDKVNLMGYEESLNILDQILDDLQQEDIPLEEIQNTYLKGKVHLQHCEQLLKHVEQITIEIDSEDIEIKE